MNKVKYTYCENDPFPINEIKDAANFNMIQDLYLKIVNKSLREAIFPQSEKLACIKPAYKGKCNKEISHSMYLINKIFYK